MARPTHGRLGSVVPGARWAWPWTATLALPAGRASALTVAVVGAPAADPDPSSPPGPSAATAALADGDDVWATFLARPEGGPTHHDAALSSDGCDPRGGRLAYVGLNRWTVLDPRDHALLG